MSQAVECLRNADSATKAVLDIIQSVENNPHYTSVGYGGLPNCDGKVQLDAAFMNGDTYEYGAVACIENYANPILIAEKLSHQKYNNLLVGSGAEQYASEHKFEKVDLLTQNAKTTWEKRVSDVEDHKLSAYDGHDTIGCIALDKQGSLMAGTSSSGLFMKKPGRVGDSPLVGCGLFADSRIGAACATGMGEDLTKGVLSYETVRQIKVGFTPQVAAENAL